MWRGAAFLVALCGLKRRGGVTTGAVRGR